MCYPVISTHTPRERRDNNDERRSERSAKFQLTRLVRGVTHNFICVFRHRLGFQLTRLVRGVTLYIV